MREATIEWITTLLDKPNPAINENEKVWRWNVTPNLDVVVQRDGSPDGGTVWVTALPGDGHPEFSEVCTLDEGRYGTTFDKCPTLAKGNAARRILIEDKGQLGETIRYLMRLKESKPNALAKRSLFAGMGDGLRGIIKGLKAVKLAAPFDPTGKTALVGEIIEGIDTVVEEIDSRKQAKRIKNAELLLRSVIAANKDADERISQIEKDLIDPFATVVENALAEDEAGKLPIYSALLNWIIMGKEADEIRHRPPNSISVRMLAAAVKDLSYLELTAMFEMFRAGRGRPKVQPLMDDNHFWARIENLGLSPRGVKNNGGASDLGQLLFNLCVSLDLKPVRGTHD